MHFEEWAQEAEQDAQETTRRSKQNKQKWQQMHDREMEEMIAMLDEANFDEDPFEVDAPTAGTSRAFYGTDSLSFKKEYTLLLIGKTGAGKSTSGNTILGKNMFKAKVGFKAVTDDCEWRIHSRNGRKFTIMDSPGLYDPQKTNKDILTAITQAVAGMHPGLNAIVYVISIGRYTQEEFAVYERLRDLFDDNLSRYMIILFTGGDRLEKDGTSMRKMIRQDLPTQLQQVLDKCNNRYVVFNNEGDDKQPQVDNLCSLIDEMMAENNNQPYTCPTYSVVGQKLEEEVIRRLKKVEEEHRKRNSPMVKLEQQVKEGELVILKTTRRFEENEQERKREMKEEEKKNQKIRDELQEQVGRTRKHEDEQQRLLIEGENLEYRMKEKEHEMTMIERLRVASEIQRLRENEVLARQRLTEEKQKLKEDEERLRATEKKRQILCLAMEEQRQKEKEEIKAAEEILKPYKEKLQRIRQRLRTKKMENVQEEAVMKGSIFDEIHKCLLQALTAMSRPTVAMLDDAVSAFRS